MGYKKQKLSEHPDSLGNLRLGRNISRCIEFQVVCMAPVARVSFMSQTHRLVLYTRNLLRIRVCGNFLQQWRALLSIPNCVIAIMNAVLQGCYFLRFALWKLGNKSIRLTIASAWKDMV